MKVFVLKVLLIAILIAGCWGMPGSAGTVSSLDDVEFWAGSGANQAGLVVDWDGKSSTDESLVWGYRWDGSLKVEDMLRDVLAADARLFSKFATISGYSSIIVNGMGYDDNDDCLFSLSDGTIFNADGIHSGVPSDGATSDDPGDLYSEGWEDWNLVGYWHVGTASTNPFGGGSWSSGSAGISDLNLVDEGWVSLAYTTNLVDFAANPIAAELPGPAADFNLDGNVDGADFLAWQRGFGILSGATRAQGDADCNQVVDDNDLLLWESAFGASAAIGAASAAGIAVPEPHSVCLLLGMSFLLTSIRLRW